MIISWFKNIYRPKYESLNRLEIVKKNILFNLSYLKSLQPIRKLFQFSNQTPMATV